MSRGRICCWALVASLLAGAAGAGPWPRGQGEAFLSLSAERDRAGHGYTGIYGEYGWTGRTTLGVELGRADRGEVSALVWMQRALDDGGGPNRIALSWGGGAISRDGVLVPVGIAGASWGRGLDGIALFRGIRDGGWISLDARIKVTGEIDATAMRDGPADAPYLAYLTPEWSAKLDATLGLRPWAGWMVINQLRLEERKDTGLSARLAGSVVRDIGGPAKLELGVVAPLSGPGEWAVKLGTWLEF